MTRNTDFMCSYIPSGETSSDNWVRSPYTAGQEHCMQHSELVDAGGMNKQIALQTDINQATKTVIK